MRQGVRDPNLFMWVEALEQLDRIERAQRQVFRPGPPAGCPSWEPPVDLFETETGYRILVALPGVRPDRLDVRLEGRTLVVAGERHFPIGDADAALVHRLELPYGRFERRIELPPGNLSIGPRELADGCLLLILHKM